MAALDHLAPRALIAIGAWLMLASIVLSWTDSVSTYSLSTVNRPVINPAVRRGHTSLQSTNDQKAEAITQQSWKSAVAATAVGIAAAQAETEQLIPFPWAATGLSLAFLAVMVYLFNEWQHSSSGFALANSGLPKYTNDIDIELAANSIAMSAVTSGKGSAEQLITVEKPLGLTLGEKSTGGVEVTFVNPLGNAAKAGIKPGDTVVYHSSFFGDELWPADKLSYVRSAINACPNAVDFIIARGAAASQINVKRLVKKPAPPRIGRKLTAAQKERATHICLDCGWIYALPLAFEQQPKDYRCPQCQATKSRFAKYDIESGKVSGNTGLPQGILAGVLASAVLVLVLGYVALSL